MAAKKKSGNLSYEELSKLILEAIEEEQFFNKATLVPKIRAIMSAFRMNLCIVDYKNLKEPSDAAKQRRAMEDQTFQKTFWQRRFRATAGEEAFKAACADLDVAMREAGFEK